ncbi:MAG: hypothetical protein FJZ96_14380, partial [Chloroflexi bacterium]|nr:hypothetical protein [Chloroflexota bacterium]
MDLLDPLTASGGMDDGSRASVLDEVIDSVNREFPGQVLRSPNEAEREQVVTRIRSLVSSGFRSRGLPPSSTEQDGLVEEIGRRVMGLG